MTHTRHPTALRLQRSCCGIVQGSRFPLSRCRLGSNSKDIDCRKLWLGGQAVPQIDGEANIAGPQRVAASPKLVACLTILSDRGHREGPGALKPHQIVGSTIKFEERIAIAARAVAEVGAFGERSSSPSEFAAFAQQVF